MRSSGRDGLFDGLFGRGDVAVGEQDWLQAMLDTEAALARAVEGAGLAAAGAGAAVTAAARADRFDVGELGRQAALTGNPVPALVRALTSLVPAEARQAVHRGATSQDIIDTAAMLLSRHAIEVIDTDLAAAADRAAALAVEHADTVMAGRTLLQQAVPVTFGLVAAGWLAGLDDARADLSRDPVQAGGPVRRRGGHARLARPGRTSRCRVAGRRTWPGQPGAPVAYRPAADRPAGRGAGWGMRRPRQSCQGRDAARAD